MKNLGNYGKSKLAQQQHTLLVDGRELGLRMHDGKIPKSLTLFLPAKGGISPYMSVT